jgi:HEAT repeat protein
MTSPANLVVVNGPGTVPTFLFPNSSADLTALLEQPQDTYTAVQIIQELAVREYGEAREVVRLHLRSPENKIKAAATTFFSHIPDPKSVTLLGALLHEGDSTVREQAYEALAFQGAASATVLVNLMNDEDPGIREAAANLFGNQSGAEVEAILLRHVNDNGVVGTEANQQVLVSASVIRSLAKVGSNKLAAQLPELLKIDNNLSVRLALIEACVQLKVIQAIPILIDMLDAAPARLHEKVHHALTQLTGADYGESQKQWLSGIAATAIEHKP